MSNCNNKLKNLAWQDSFAVVSIGETFCDYLIVRCRGDIKLFGEIWAEIHVLNHKLLFLEKIAVHSRPQNRKSKTLLYIFVKFEGATSKKNLPQLFSRFNAVYDKFM